MSLPFLLAQTSQTFSLPAVILSVAGNRHSKIRLADNNVLIVGHLDDTVFWGRVDMLESWQDLYLPHPTQMAVLGTISIDHGIPLIILMGEDGKIYAYYDEELHLLANTFYQLYTEGFNWPGLWVYEYGRGFCPTSNDEYMAALADAGLEKVSPETRAFVAGNAKDMEEMLDDLVYL